MSNLQLSPNDRDALLTALERYTDGHGMADFDEDEDTLDAIYERLRDA